ncbi:stage II sporulation protein M [Desulfosediminicola ganghwensis]|uniref:stage II sporulation protein M n=1 Tax=Desulfosediminicola ganghwensis TaxID=2569540 RepID=UPI0010ACC590|nr:stage II sporulation protein M [Desulfosediminicola ganghwensis]
MKFNSNQIIQIYIQYVAASFEEQKKYTLFTVLMLIVGGITGFADVLGINEEVNKMVLTFVAQFQKFHGIELFTKIFYQNARAALIVILAGIIFSIFPVFAAITNGLIIGCVVSTSKSNIGISSLESILRLIPHGIFEIPAFVLAIALGVKLGLWPFNTNKIEYIKTTLKRAAHNYILIIIPLLIVAGLIEVALIEISRN